MSIELHNGDCLEVMKHLPDKSVDCFICDLPYGQTNTKTCPWDTKINLSEFWTQIKRLCKNDHTPILMFCTTKFGIELVNSNPSWFRYDLVWDKTRGISFLSANKMPMRSHEMIYVFSKSGAFYIRVDETGDFKAWKRWGNNKSILNVYGMAHKTDNTFHSEGKRCVKSVISFKNSNKPKVGGHPTEKPISLYKWLIERYCPDGGTLLDPTAGSGNAGLAAWELNRHAILIEKDTTFFKKIEDKMNNLSTT